MKNLPLFLPIVLALLAGRSNASHVVGAEIRYSHLQGFTYTIQGVLYSDLSSPADRPEIIMMIDGALDTIPRTSIEDQPLAGCGGLRRSIYEVEHTFPGNGTYVISFDDNFRSAGIVNIPSSVSTPICVQSKLVISDANGSNNSIHFSQPPTSFDLSWNVISHDPLATEVDGDELSFELIDPLGLDCAPIPSYSFPEATNFLWIDPASGAWAWDHPTAQGLYVLAIKGTERRNGEIVGEVIRDMMVCLSSYEVGIGENGSNADISVWPSMTDGIVNISHPWTTARLEILDRNGAIIRNEMLPGGRRTIDLGNEAAGVYMFRFTLPDGRQRTVRILRS